jgi:hypothetical protein
MTTFYSIIEKIIKPEINPFSKKHDKNDTVPPIVRTFFRTFLYSTNFKTKFQFFNDTINHVLLNNYTDDFTYLFYKIQKTYNAFRKLSYIYKYKKADIVVNKDMELNEIYEYSKNIICIYQNNSKYLFNVKDLIQIINNSLTNSVLFFAEPIYVKNPYNNLPFNKSTLYNIYFYIKFNTNIYSEFVFKYFQTNFDLTIFLHNNEHLIREYSIKNYVMKSPNNVIYEEIIYMIESYNRQYINEPQKQIIIDKNFPVEKLIKIMKPYLLLYFNITYSLVPLSKENSRRELEYKLKKFQSFNPNFGKKITLTKEIYKKYNSNNETIFYKRNVFSHIEFNDKHVSFNETSNYMNNHLTLDKLYYDVESDEDEEITIDDDADYNVFYLDNESIS